MILSPKKEKRGFVYLLCDQGKNFVYKIGVTTGSIAKRIKSLQTGNSGEITICRYYETDIPFFIEKSMHFKYFGKKVMNEWFNLTSEQVNSFEKDCMEIEKLTETLKENPFFPKKLR